MTERKAIQTDNAPAALGPYSQALLVGDTLYISGQLGIDPATGKLVGGDTAEQAKQALNNIMAILVEANMSMHNVAQVQVFRCFCSGQRGLQDFFRRALSGSCGDPGRGIARRS